MITTNLLECACHNSQVSFELLGHTQDLVRAVEHLHCLGVGVEPVRYKISVT